MTSNRTSSLWHRMAIATGMTVLALFGAGPANAAIVNYAIQGVFTGINSGDATLTSAIAPVLGIQIFSVRMTIDTNTLGTGALSGGTLYRAVSNTSSSFAGFSSTSDSCSDGTSEFICTVRARDGTGVIGGTGVDEFSLFAGIGQSGAFQTAAGESRPLDFQFAFFLSDFTGATLTSESLGLDLTTLDPNKLTSRFAVFAPTTGANQGFDRADFGLRVTSISLQGQEPTPVPEPGSLSLVLLACLLLFWRSLHRYVEDRHNEVTSRISRGVAMIWAA